MEGEHEDATRLFEGIPEDKRIGILRTYHHRMYKNDENDLNEKESQFSRCLSYYCVKNKGSCLVISISFALIVVGVLSITYGFMTPGLYKSIGKNGSYTEQLKDVENYTYYKDLFIIFGIVMVSFGVLAASFGFFVPLYKDSAKKMSATEECQRTPIIVDYELPPYNTSLQTGNYLESDSSWLSSCGSPIEQEGFKTFFIQEEK